MFRNLIKNAIYISRRSETTIAKAKWDIHVGLLVERLPIISKNLNEIESDVMVRRIKCEMNVNENYKIFSIENIQSN
jgi:hypothetical protein